MYLNKLIYTNSFKSTLLNIDHYLLHYNIVKNCTNSSVANQSAVKSIIDKETSKLFFSFQAQKLMKNLTGLDLDKVFRTRKAGEKVFAAKFKFMTTKQFEAARHEALKKAKIKLQMPPLVPPVNEAEVEVLQEVPELIGFDTAKFVFTDISFGVSDRQRVIVVREPDGVLRKALPHERHRMNELYFPREGREYIHPPMFQEENLRPLWEKGEFEYVLDRTCCQFEPDDPEFHEVTFKTYDQVNEKNAFNCLRSTRHYGTLVFYLCLRRNIDNLLTENLEHNRLNDAVLAIELYGLVNHECKFNSLNLNATEDEIKYIKSFIETESFKRNELLSLLESYNDIKQVSGVSESKMS